MKKEVVENRELNEQGAEDATTDGFRPTKYFVIRRFFAMKTHVYVLTGASRGRNAVDTSLSRFDDRQVEG